jgi:hypothetical protein
MKVHFMFISMFKAIWSWLMTFDYAVFLLRINDKKVFILIHSYRIKDKDFNFTQFNWLPNINHCKRTFTAYKGGKPKFDYFNVHFGFLFLSIHLKIEK